MTQTVQQYDMGGLDLRTNDLYRNSRTSSDNRNVYLDSNKRIRKRPDLDQNVLARGADEEINTFIDKLPFGAEVIDLMEYEDYVVVATKILRDIPALTKFFYVNKFYKWIKDTNTLEYIPFQSFVSVEDEIGQFKDYVDGNIDGKFSYINQEKNLYFIGNFADTDLANTATEIAGGYPLDPNAQDNNLSFTWVYDGKVIKAAGVSNPIEEDNILTTLADPAEEYLRIVPFTLDFNNRPVFGNYKTISSDLFTAIGNINNTEVDFAYNTPESMCFFRSILGKSSMLDSGTDASRTLVVDIKDLPNFGKSVGVGQYLYSIGESNARDPFVANGAPPFYDSIRVSFQVFRLEIKSVDYGTGEVVVHNFYNWDIPNQTWSNSGVANVAGNTLISNYMFAVYGSTSTTEGFEFRTVASPAHVVDDTYAFTHISDYSVNVTDVFYTSPFGFLTTFFEDFYDESTVKLPPPKARDIVNYIGANVLIDEKSVYFSDFSVGGNIESYTPFDTFGVGSSEFGDITGVFANETFLVIFREYETYYITGNIITANYRIQSYRSTRIGCSDPKGIIDYKGAGIFTSERGIFVAQQGGSLGEISDVIEPLFFEDALGLDLNMYNAKVSIDWDKELFYFDIINKAGDNSYIVVYSYYHNEWFIWDGIPTLGGSTTLQNKLYTSDGIDIYTEGTTAINSEAYYQSNFETAGNPQLDKKFLRMWVSTKDMPACDITLKTFINWNRSEVTTEEAITLLDNELDVDMRVVFDRVRSMAFRIESAAGNPLIIDGYSYEVDDASTETIGNVRTK